MKRFGVSIFLTVLAMPGAALAQQQQPTAATLDRDCPIPYTVGRQQTVLQGYLRVSEEIGQAIPGAGGLSGITLEGIRVSIRNIIAGEAEQALADVRTAYLCRLRRTLPEQKHAHAEALIQHAGDQVQLALLPSNWESIPNAAAAQRYFRDLNANPNPDLDTLPAERRVTAAEIMAAIGNPDFRSRNTTRTQLSARAFGIGGGLCRGVVQATQATVDNATIGALAAHHTVLADLTSQTTRQAAYSRLLIDARSVSQPTSVTQVVNSLQAAPDPTQVQTCLTQVTETTSPSPGPGAGPGPGTTPGQGTTPGSGPGTTTGGGQTR